MAKFSTSDDSWATGLTGIGGSAQMKYESDQKAYITTVKSNQGGKLVICFDIFGHVVFFYIWSSGTVRVGENFRLFSGFFNEVRVFRIF